MTDIEKLQFDNEEYRIENDSLANTVRSLTNELLRYDKSLARSRLICLLLIGISTVMFFTRKR